MRLETARRKLWPHRRRWEIVMTVGGTINVGIKATFKKVHGDIPIELLGWPDIETDERLHSIWTTGFANAMAEMADKLDKIENAIQLHEQAKAATKEATS